MLDKNIYPKVFAWLFAGLLITFGSGYLLSLNEELTTTLITVGVIPIIIIELVIAVLMGARIQKMKVITAKICYVVFSITTGITFASAFIYYELSSLMSIFFITAVIFGVLALYGYFTKNDLSKFGTFIFISLIVTIIAELLNYLIFKSSTGYIVISAFAIMLFCGYIMYDMQKIKRISSYLDEEKAAVYGAFQLYLDFINIFIRLLELFGKKKD